MSKKQRLLVALPLVVAVCLASSTAQAQVGGGTWKAESLSFNVQERGCGDVNNLTFTLTCSTGSGDQRAERRYATYTGGTHQFEGSFRITSMSGSRISLKQTFKDNPGAGPYWMLAVERGGRLYLVHGADTIGSEARVGATVRVNTIHRVGSGHEVYINGSKRGPTKSSPGGSFYHKLGFYRTASGNGPGSVVWSGIKFWRR